MRGGLEALKIMYSWTRVSQVKTSKGIAETFTSLIPHTRETSCCRLPEIVVEDLERSAHLARQIHGRLLVRHLGRLEDDAAGEEGLLVGAPQRLLLRLRRHRLRLRAPNDLVVRRGLRLLPCIAVGARLVRRLHSGEQAIGILVQAL